MNEFRKTVKNRMLMLGTGLLAAVVVVAAVILTAGRTAGGGTDERLSSFVSGLFFGFCIVLILYLVRLGLALRSETRLNALYRSENDERRQMIRRSALGKSFFITAGALVVVVSSGLVSVPSGALVVGSGLFSATSDMVNGSRLVNLFLREYG